MSLQVVAEKINILADFCGKRDVQELTREELIKKYNIEHADSLILFGGSILEGCKVAGKAMLNGVAKKLMIVGGEGHTTESLRKKVKEECPEIETENKMEADIMGQYMNLKYNIKDYYIERESTNCGNNVTYALRLLNEKNIEAKNIIIIQDATMQHRMEAGFRKYDSNINIINYASYKTKVIVKEDKLTFEKNNILGMWDLERYISLLMGEIPRLNDNESGYGPNGRGYIAHVEVPKDVLDAFEYLKGEYRDLVRA
ncbi:hypothetical protein CQ395_16140 [Clostridium neonatale]|uniref:Uncharacterized protein n=1 Tax=Clostridium neonatale TaxID=137838 RepID=A0A2A7MJ19_9CLOT|nr:MULTISPECIES: ElyC/SanA/YdcF family protein [Clostridium]MDU4478368.1 ElyC/SanA/YdcF family protein [Clostridium sp.]PEG25761.1 hypothetical protein CQ395_16140 [Clostridium neonatale]PEG31695.1 hypothetical protein CQ394_08360 [Clostridium neonatale]CAH0437798.1 Conserved hypothetical protein [Clostridium neonatale]CAI3234607.1 Conserved hypothetical protein [Clostridium neonatale]